MDLKLNEIKSVNFLFFSARSPVFAHLSATLQGLPTIRAFGAGDILTREFDNHQDLHSSAWYIFIASSRAFGFWLDVFCVVYIVLVTLSFLVMNNYSRGSMDGGYVGLAITQSIGLTGMFQWGMRQSAELENQMTSVERILEYRYLSYFCHGFFCIFYVIWYFPTLSVQMMTEVYDEIYLILFYITIQYGKESSILILYLSHLL